MEISAPTTVKLGESGTVTVSDVNFKTAQDILIEFGRLNRRFAIEEISVITDGVDTLSNGASVIVKEVDQRVFTAATLSTSMTGTNNDVTLTAVTAGTSGNSITLTLVDPSANDQAISVSVDGTDITVNLATDGGGSITTTATQLIAAIEGNAAASALVTIDNKGSDNGSGVVTALSESALTGGLNWTEKFTIVASSDLVDSDKQGLIQKLTLAVNQEVVEGGNSIQFAITTGATATTDNKDILIKYTVL